MSLLLLVASLLFGNQPCDPGVITLYEDMSYTITPSESALVCNLREIGNSAYNTPVYIDYWQLSYVDSHTVLVEHIAYTLGDPFPESVQRTAYYYVLYTEPIAPAYDYVRLGDSIYSL